MIDKALEVMKNELMCVEAADKCDRHCEDCPLVMEAEDIIEAYKWIIKLLEDKKREDRYTGRWIDMMGIKMREMKRQ